MSYLTFLATLLAAIAAACSAYSALQANKITKENLRIQSKILLFPQRLELYRAIQAFIGKAGSYKEGNSWELFNEILPHLNEKQFLISDKDYHFIKEEVYETVNKLVTVVDSGPGNTEQERLQSIETLHKLRKKNLDNMDKVEELFTPYLRIETH